MVIKIYTDGASRGNPGKAAAAFVIVKENKIINQDSKYLGIKTNNEAEYLAILFALEKTKTKEFELISDSELVIKQITGEYKTTQPHLQKLKNQVDNLQKHKKIKFSNAKRDHEFIKISDRLVNNELDKH
jgi:ribonuclease HI